MVANMIFLNEYNEPRELSVIDTSTARLRSLFSTTGGFRFWWGINAAGFGFSVEEVVDYFPMVKWVDGAVKRNQSPGRDRSSRWCTIWEGSIPRERNHDCVSERDENIPALRRISPIPRPRAVKTVCTIA